MAFGETVRMFRKQCALIAGVLSLLLASTAHSDPVNVTVWVVSNTNGVSPATSSRISTVIANANKALWQTAVSLEWGGAINTATNSNWYHLQVPAGTNFANSSFSQLMDCSRDTKGIEIYFVNSITDADGNALGGVNSEYGLALGVNATGHILAHEVLHQCGLRDIYVNIEGVALTVEGGLSEDRMPLDWGGGYYPPGIQMADIIRNRLIMYGIAECEEAIVIPRGNIYGLGYRVLPTGTKEWFLGMIPVGQDSIKTRKPEHK